MNNLRNIKVFQNYTIFECIKSPEWIDYLKDTSKTLQINNDLVKLFQTFVNRLSIKDYSVETFCNVLKNDLKTEDEKRISNLFDYWKKYEASIELKASEYFYKLLTCKNSYPDYLYFLFGTTYNVKQKAKSIHDLIDLWSDVKRSFFRLVFKFVNYSRRTNLKPRKILKKDLNYIVYEQASNALWDYIESLNISSCNKKSKKKLKQYSLGEKWIHWASESEMYPDFVNFMSIKNRETQQKLKVFSYFIKIYLNSKSKFIKIV